jgi:hypothetical protein
MFLAPWFAATFTYITSIPPPEAMLPFVEYIFRTTLHHTNFSYLKHEL